jgi:hypothetical protein
MTSHDYDYFDDLMRQRCYATVKQGIDAQETDDPRLDALRGEAKDFFAIGVRKLWEIYRDTCGSNPADTGMIEQLRVRYDEQVGAIFEPVEADAYARALLDEARQLIREQATPDAVRLRLFAAKTLPIDADDLAAAVELELTRLQQPAVNPAQTVVLPETNDKKEAKTLTLPEVQRDLGDATEQEDQILIQLRRISSLLFDPDTDLATIRPLLEKVQATIDRAGSPNIGLLEQLEQRYAVRQEQFPAIDELLQRPLRDWIMHAETYARTGEERLTRIRQAFGATAEITQQMVRRFEQQLTECRQVSARIEALEDAQGAALGSELADLERMLGADFAPLRAAQQRRAAYEEAQQRLGQERSEDKLRNQYLALRREFDSALRSYVLDETRLQDLHDRARRASQDSTLVPGEHPLDPATFAYYDLLYRDYQRNIQETQTGEAARTAESMGERYQALNLYYKNLEQTRAGDIPAAVEKAREQYERYRAATIEAVKQEFRQTISEAGKALESYDYADALEKLRTQEQNLEDGNAQLKVAIEVGPDLRTQVDELINQAEMLEEQDQQAQAQIRTAFIALFGEQNISETFAQGKVNKQFTQGSITEKPDFKQAIAGLDEAGNLADWRMAEMQATIATLREKQRRFVEDTLKRADREQHGGAFSRARELLDQADINAEVPEQRSEIDRIRNLIDEQLATASELEHMLNALMALAEDARKGDNLDVLRSRIEGQRDRIGTPQTSLFDAADWEKLNAWLRTAEERVKIWTQYRQLLNQAEVAAGNNEPEQVADLTRQLRSLSEYDYLPIVEDVARIRNMAQTGSRVEFARNLLNETRTRLSNQETAVSVEDLNHVMMITGSFSAEENKEYPDIANDREFIKGFLELYIERDRFNGLLTDEKYAEIQEKYQALPGHLQADPTIQRCRDMAAASLARQQFDQQLAGYLGSVTEGFNQGWDQPENCLSRVQELIAFADNNPRFRGTVPALSASALKKLQDLAQLLRQARRDQFDQQDYSGAKDTIQSIVGMVPTSRGQADNPLVHYFNELLKFRSDLLNKFVRRAEDYENKQEEAQERFAKVRNSYYTCIKDTSFDSLALRDVINQFVAVKGDQNLSDSNKAEITLYEERLNDILELLEKVDAIEEIFISGKDRYAAVADASAIQAAAQPGRTRLVGARIDETIKQSKAIKERGKGAEIWPGVQYYPLFRAISDTYGTGLAETLDAADVWLQTAQQPGRKLGTLREQQEQGRDLIKKLDPDLVVEGETRLQRLRQYCISQRNAINGRLKDDDGIEVAIKRAANRGKLRQVVVVFLVMLAAVGIIGWSIPRVREEVGLQATLLLVGTLTPTATMTPTPSAPVGEVPTPTPLVVTATPVPTATPIPPQTALVIFPGRAWTYNRPVVDEGRRVDWVSAGLDAFVTGYTNDPDGDRWYRIDVVGRSGLTGVWIAAQLPDRGEVHDTVRVLDNAGNVNEQLFIPFDQAMQ